jgi:predicted enzyme related to lactoylglutathione lyase
VFEVDDLDAARAALEAKGVEFLEHVGEVEGFARFASFLDPDGNTVQIIEYRKEEA